MTEEANVRESIGGLKATMQHLSGTIEHMTRMWSDQERAAGEGRRILHQKVDDLRLGVTVLTHRLDQVEKTLVDIKPAVEEFEHQREQQKGAMKVGKAIWTAMLAACGGTGAAIGWGFSHLFGSGVPPTGH